MFCKVCESRNLIQISAHARDCFNVTWLKSGYEHDGYFPEELPALGAGDDLDITLCLSCGVCQEIEI